jgi:phosphoribosylformimino-5-aminoimidazole carboxamide ribotide isomerase
MQIFPAIDIIGGKVVRLTKGDYNVKTEYKISPEQAATGFMEQGASHIHVVDLDGAKTGMAENAGAVQSIIKASGAFVEIGGGIRTEEQIKEYLNAGAGRVILGTVAVKNPDFTAKMVQKYGSRIAVGVDALGGKVAISGWKEVTNFNDFEFCVNLQKMGVQTVIYTDIATDGALQGTNLNCFKKLVTIPDLHIVASGGISSIEEIYALKQLGVQACILGKALYEGKLSLKDAVLAGEGDRC